MIVMVVFLVAEYYQLDQIEKNSSKIDCFFDILFQLFLHFVVITFHDYTCLLNVYTSLLDTVGVE